MYKTVKLVSRSPIRFKDSILFMFMNESYEKLSMKNSLKVLGGGYTESMADLSLSFRYTRCAPSTQNFAQISSLTRATLTVAKDTILPRYPKLYMGTYLLSAQCPRFSAERDL